MQSLVHVSDAGKLQHGPSINREKKSPFTQSRGAYVMSIRLIRCDLLASLRRPQRTWPRSSIGCVRILE